MWRTISGLFKSENVVDSIDAGREALAQEDFAPYLDPAFPEVRAVRELRNRVPSLSLINAHTLTHRARAERASTRKAGD